MIQKLFLNVKKLYALAKKLVAILLMQSGDLLKKIIFIHCITPTSYREAKILSLIDMIKRANLKNRKKLPYGCSIIMVSGMPMAVDEKYLQQLEKENEEANIRRNGKIEKI